MKVYWLLLVILAFAFVFIFTIYKAKSILDKAEKQNRRLKKQMTSNVAHELRTPVTCIRGYLETLISCPEMDLEKRKTFLERAYNQTLRLSELISDMALISKMEESPEMLPTQSVDLGYLTQEVFEEFAGAIIENNIKIDNFLQEGLVIHGNSSLLHALFRNLVENSIKYAGGDIRLHLECHSRNDQTCYFTYYDTGKGVPEEHIDKIFERFYRVSEGRTRDSGGSGLGLSIVRNAVAFHGGDIKVENRPNGGLQFTFSLNIR